MPAVTVKKQDGSTFTADFDGETTVESFKESIAENAGVVATEQRLVWKGHVLHDIRTLESYEIKENDTIYLLRNVPRPQGPSAVPVPGQQASAPGPFGLDQQQMSAMMNNPMMNAMFENPDFMRMVMNMNPQLQRVRESNPEIGRMLDDPQFLRDVGNMMRNPNLMREMMRNNDRALANISAMPGGMNHINQLYSSIQEPLYAGLTPAAPPDAGPRDYEQTTEVNAEAMPNPWGGGGGGGAGAGRGTAPQRPAGGLEGLPGAQRPPGGMPGPMGGMFGFPPFGGMGAVPPRPPQATATGGTTGTTPPGTGTGAPAQAASTGMPGTGTEGLGQRQQPGQAPNPFFPFFPMGGPLGGATMPGVPRPPAPPAAGGGGGTQTGTGTATGGSGPSPGGATATATAPGAAEETGGAQGAEGTGATQAAPPTDPFLLMMQQMTENIRRAQQQQQQGGEGTTQTPFQQQAAGTGGVGGARPPFAPFPFFNPFLAQQMQQAAQRGQQQQQQEQAGGGTTGAPGQAPPAAPPAAPTAPPEERYRGQLASLRDMGFTDVAHCVRVLDECGGNLNRALDRLLGGG